MIEMRISIICAAYEAAPSNMFYLCAQCENPKRDLPIGIVGSLLVTTLLYVATAGVSPCCVYLFSLTLSLCGPTTLCASICRCRPCP